MMVNIAQIKSGAKKYIENEILGQIADWRKWVIGAFVDPFLNRIDPIVNDASARETLSKMGIISQDNEHIDIDKLRDMFLTQAHERGRVSVNVPLVGAYFIGEQDIHKIYECIISS